jgi:hypothetical protein
MKGCVLAGALLGLRFVCGFLAQTTGERVPTESRWQLALMAPTRTRGVAQACAKDRLLCANIKPCTHAAHAPARHVHPDPPRDRPSRRRIAQEMVQKVGRGAGLERRCLLSRQLASQIFREDKVNAHIPSFGGGCDRERSSARFYSSTAFPGGEDEEAAATELGGEAQDRRANTSAWLL